jgi:hypothetical protein
MTKNKNEEEIIKCGNNPLYFMTNYVPLETFDGHLQFNPNIDSDVIQEIHSQTDTNIYTELSTNNTKPIILYMFWFGLFHSNKNLAIYSKNKIISDIYYSGIATLYDSLPVNLVPTIKRRHIFKIWFSNGSNLFFFMHNDDVNTNYAQGFQFNMAYIDEFEEIYPGNRESYLLEIKSSMKLHR